LLRQPLGLLAKPYKPRRRVEERLGLLVRYEVKGVFKQSYSPFSGYTGFMVRGALGYALRRLVCSDLQAECRSCPLLTKCFYAYFFETSSAVKPDAELAVKSGRSGVTKPYVVSPLSVKGRRVEFTVTLFGPRALQAEPVLVSSLLSMSSRGLGMDPSLGDRRRFEILEVAAYDPVSSKQRVAYTHRRGYVYEPSPAQRVDLLEALKEKARAIVEAKPSQLTLNLHTPTQIRAAGRPVENPSLRHVVANLARKYSLLAHYHEVGRPLTAKEAKEAIELAEKVQGVEAKVSRLRLRKHSLKEGRVKEFGPFIKGQLTYNTPPTLWKNSASTLIAALLILGQYTGVGSLTTAGCGNYTITLKLTP